MDMHLDDSKPDEYLSKLDTDDFVKTLVDSNVTNIVVKAKSHVGLHYYPCKAVKLLTSHENENEKELEVLTSFENGETTIKLPKLDIFHIIEVEI